MNGYESTNNFMAPMQSVSMRVKSLILHDTGTFNNQVMRPYVTNVTGDSISNIMTSLESNRPQRISAEFLSGTVSNILSVSARPESSINIPNGWDTRRFRFILIVEVDFNVGNMQRHFFQGYTDHYGLSLGNKLDQNMRFHINSFINVAVSQVKTPMGLSEMENVVESISMLTNGSQSGYGSVGLSPFSMIRPVDIFTGIESAPYLNAAVSDTYDTRSMMGTGTHRSNRENNLPTNYMAKIFDTFLSTSRASGFTDNYKDVIGASIVNLDEKGIGGNPFIRAISSIYQSAAPVSSFTLTDLMSVDSNANHAISLIEAPARLRNEMAQAGRTEYWEAQTRETVAATIIVNGISAIMMELMVTKIKLTSSNHDITGRMYTALVDMKALTSADMSNNADRLVRRFENEIMNDVTFNNQDRYTLRLEVDLFGETVIAISLSGDPEVVYSSPSFSDSLLAPVITSNSSARSDMINDFESILSMASEAVNGSGIANGSGSMPQSVVGKNKF
jgi:uncharacterized protein YvpB